MSERVGEDEYEDPQPEPPILVQVRLPRKLVRRLDHFAIDEDLYRAQAVALLLAEALRARGIPP